jgi:hypothetical protein
MFPRFLIIFLDSFVANFVCAWFPWATFTIFERRPKHIQGRIANDWIHYLPFACYWVSWFKLFICSTPLYRAVEVSNELLRSQGLLLVTSIAHEGMMTQSARSSCKEGEMNHLKSLRHCSVVWSSTLEVAVYQSSSSAFKIHTQGKRHPPPLNSQIGKVVHSTRNEIQWLIMQPEIGVLVCWFGVKGCDDVTASPVSWNAIISRPYEPGWSVTCGLRTVAMGSNDIITLSLLHSFSSWPLFPFCSANIPTDN